MQSTIHIFSDSNCLQLHKRGNPYVLASFAANKYWLVTMEVYDNYKQTFRTQDPPRIVFVQRSCNLDPQDWENFKKEVKKHYGLDISDDHKPGFCV